MTTPRDRDEILSAWMDEGPSQLPDQTRRAIAVAIPTTSQRRSIAARLWRSPQMQQLPKLAVGAMAVVAVVLGGAFLLGPTSHSSAGGPTLTPATASAQVTPPAATPSPPVGGTPIAMVTYASRQYGYSVDLPRTWSVTPASEPWPAGDRLEADPAAADRFRIEGSPIDAAVAIAAQTAPEGATVTTWLAEWERIREDIGGHCFGSATPWQQTTVAGLPAWHIAWRCDSGGASEKSNWDEYTFLAGGRGYVISGTPSMVGLVVDSFRAK